MMLLDQPERTLRGGLRAAKKVSDLVQGLIDPFVRQSSIRVGDSA